MMPTLYKDLEGRERIWIEGKGEARKCKVQGAWSTKASVECLQKERRRVQYSW